MKKYLDELPSKNLNHIGCGLFCDTKFLREKNKEYHQMYYKAVMEYEMITNYNNILGDPYISRVRNYNYWHSFDKLYKASVNPESNKDHRIIFLAITGGGIGFVVLISIILGLKRCMSNKDNEPLNQAQDIREINDD